MAAASRCVYLVNSTPKYYYMLPLHFQLLERYGSPFTRSLKKVLATEVPDHPICREVAEKYGVRILSLKMEEAGFLDSRAAALKALEAEGRWDFVLPMQEDFLLDRRDAGDWIEGVALSTLSLNATGVASIRLMPCPGPKGPQLQGYDSLAEITPRTDEYGFVFQATLWRLDACAAWYKALCEKLEANWPRATTDPRKRIEVEVRANFAENAEGQRFFWEFFAERGQCHIGYKRAGPWSNAVYLCPWPYRPTAIVKGRLETWAEEMGRREGLPLKPAV
jgi:hypothetical protein